MNDSTWLMRWALVAGLCILVSSVACDEPSRPEPTPPPALRTPEPPSSPVSHETRLGESLQELRQTPALRYVGPAPGEGERYRAWVGHLSTSALEGRLPSESLPVGFVGRMLDSGRVWLLAETAGKNRGAGAVALRVTADVPIIVEVPHSFFDEGTLPIALTVFEVLGARALLVNTVHRGGTGSDTDRLERARSGTSESDVAHQSDSFFQEAHLELGRVWPKAHVIQIHGFRDEKVPSAKLIISAAGTSAATAPLAKAINDSFGAGTARLYPEEVNQLGGTENVQARANVEENRGFIHIEMAASLRTQMLRQRALQERFARALAKGLSVE